MRKFKQYLLSFKNNYLDARKKHQEHFDHAARKGHYTYAEEGRGLVKKVDSLIAQLDRDINLHELPTPEMHHTFKQAKKHAKQLTEMVKPLWRQWVESLGFALVLVFVLRNFIFSLYHVPSGSAEPNLLVGDRVWGNKMAYFFDTVKHGDLVVFDNQEVPYEANKIKYFWQRYIGVEIPFFGIPSGPDNVVKRVIGIPGDIIEGKIENGKTAVYRNGKKLNEPYVNSLPLIRAQRETGFIPFKRFGPLTIPNFIQRLKNDRLLYVFDPQKSLQDQSYYRLEPDEIVFNQTGHEKIFSHAYSPIYTTSSRNENSIVCIDQFGPITVPEGKYWGMGDSRKNSRDSRFWGFIDKERIHGRASFVIYSIDSEEAWWLFELIKHPIDFWTKKIRWNRFFKSLWTFNGIEE